MHTGLRFTSRRTHDKGTRAMYIATIFDCSSTSSTRVSPRKRRVHNKAPRSLHAQETPSLHTRGRSQSAVSARRRRSRAEIQRQLTSAERVRSRPTVSQTTTTVNAHKHRPLLASRPRSSRWTNKARTHRLQAVTAYPSTNEQTSARVVHFQTRPFGRATAWRRTTPGTYGLRPQFVAPAGDLLLGLA